MYAGESNLFLEGKAAWEAPLISGCKGSGESEEKSHTDPPSSPTHHSAPHLPCLGSAGLLPPAGTSISQAISPKGTQDSPSSKEQTLERPLQPTLCPLAGRKQNWETGVPLLEPWSGCPVGQAAQDPRERGAQQLVVSLPLSCTHSFEVQTRPHKCRGNL